MSQGESQLGQELDDRFGITVPYVQEMLDRQEADKHIGDANTEIVPNDAASAKSRTFDLTKFAAVMDAFYIAYPNIVDVQLPDILDSIGIVWEKSQGVGSGTESGIANTTGTTFSYSLSSSIESQGSAAVMPELAIEYTEGNIVGADVDDYYFFLKSPVTKDQIITKVALLSGIDVSAWPVYTPKGHTIVLRGQKVSISQRTNMRVSSQASPDGSSYAQSSGVGSSEDYGSSIRAVSIRPTIHGQIVLGIVPHAVTSIVAGAVTAPRHGLLVNDPFYFTALTSPGGGVAINTIYFAKVITSPNAFTYAATAGGAALTGHSATAGTFTPYGAVTNTASAEALVGSGITGGSAGGDIGLNTTPALNTAVGSITPYVLGATPGATSIQLGDFLWKVDTDPYKFGYIAVRARVLHVV